MIWLDKLIGRKQEYNEESQSIIDSLSAIRAEIGAFETMKQTEGWQLLEKKIREELQARIHKLVKDDVNIQTLLALLQVTDTKTRITTLEGEIEKMLPDS